MLDDKDCKKFRHRTKKYLSKWMAPCELRDGFVFVGEHKHFIDAEHFVDCYKDSQTMFDYECKCDLMISQVLMANLDIAQAADDIVQTVMEGF